VGLKASQVSRHYYFISVVDTTEIVTSEKTVSFTFCFCETEGVTSQKTFLFIGYFYVHFRYVRINVIPSAIRFPTVYFILSLSLFQKAINFLLKLR